MIRLGRQRIPDDRWTVVFTPFSWAWFHRDEYVPLMYVRHIWWQIGPVGVTRWIWNDRIRGDWRYSELNGSVEWFPNEESTEEDAIKAAVLRRKR